MVVVVVVVVVVVISSLIHLQHTHLSWSVRHINSLASQVKNLGLKGVCVGREGAGEPLNMGATCWVLRHGQMAEAATERLSSKCSDDLRRDDHASKRNGMFEKLEAWESNFVVPLIFPLDWI